MCNATALLHSLVVPEGISKPLDASGPRLFLLGCCSKIEGGSPSISLSHVIILSGHNTKKLTSFLNCFVRAGTMGNLGKWEKRLNPKEPAQNEKKRWVALTLLSPPLLGMDLPSFRWRLDPETGGLKPIDILYPCPVLSLNCLACWLLCLAAAPPKAVFGAGHSF